MHTNRVERMKKPAGTAAESSAKRYMQLNHRESFMQAAAGCCSSACPMRAVAHKQPRYDRSASWKENTEIHWELQGTGWSERERERDAQAKGARATRQKVNAECRMQDVEFQKQLQKYAPYSVHNHEDLPAPFSVGQAGVCKLQQGYCFVSGRATVRLARSRCGGSGLAWPAFLGCAHYCE